jgi:hypothetical protein
MIDDGAAATARRPHKMFKVRAPFGGNHFPNPLIYSSNRQLQILDTLFVPVRLKR